MGIIERFGALFCCRQSDKLANFWGVNILICIHPETGWKYNLFTPFPIDLGKTWVQKALSHILGEV